MRFLSIVHGRNARSGVYREAIEDAGHTVEERSFALGQAPEDLHGYDGLIVLGGAMNVHEEDANPWIPTERRMIEEYEATVRTLLNGLTPDNHALAMEIASIPDAIRGYGHIKDKSIAEAKAKEAELLNAWHDPAKAALWNGRQAAE